MSGDLFYCYDTHPTHADQRYIYVDGEGWTNVWLALFGSDEIEYDNGTCIGYTWDNWYTFTQSDDF